MSVKNYKRNERVGPAIRGLICECLRRKVHDPRVKSAVVTEVDVSPDLRAARVYYHSLDPEVDREALQKGLDSICSFLRKEIGDELQLRYTPRLAFSYDTTFEQARRIEELLSDIEPDEINSEPSA